MHCTLISVVSLLVASAVEPVIALEAPLPSFVPNPDRLMHLPSAQRELLMEYPDHLLRLRRFYQSLSMLGESKSESRANTADAWKSHPGATGSLKCLEYQSFRWEYYDPRGGKRLAIINPREWYLYRTNSSGEYFAEANGFTSQKVIDDRLGGFIVNSNPHSYGYLYDAICESSKLDTIVHGVKEWQDVELGRIVEVTIHTPLKPPYRKLNVIQFLRDREWATSELVFATVRPDTKQYSVLRLSNTYGVDDPSGVPLLKEAIQYPSVIVPFSEQGGDPTAEYLPGAAEEPLRRDRVVVSEIIPGPPPASEFEPLPEIRRFGPVVKPTAHTWRGWLMLLNAFLLLLFGVFLLKRKRKPDAPPPAAP